MKETAGMFFESISGSFFVYNGKDKGHGQTGNND